MWDLHFRTFSSRDATHEVDFATALGAKEEWNSGLHDAEYFFRTDPEGRYVAPVISYRLSVASFGKTQTATRK